MAKLWAIYKEKKCSTVHNSLKPSVAIWHSWAQLQTTRSALFSSKCVPIGRRYSWQVSNMPLEQWIEYDRDRRCTMRPQDGATKNSFLIFFFPHVPWWHTRHFGLFAENIFEWVACTLRPVLGYLVTILVRIKYIFYISDS